MGREVQLNEHPNFKPPEAPSGLSVREIVTYTLEYAARLVSPPKVDGESDEISCELVADQLRASANDCISTLLGGLKAR